MVKVRSSSNISQNLEQDEREESSESDEQMKESDIIIEMKSNYFDHFMSTIPDEMREEVIGHINPDLESDSIE